jgi:hypothetical protein
MTSAISPEKLEIVEPQFGCVFFKDISYKKMMTSFQTKRSKKLEKVNLAYRRARDNARTASSQFAARIESDHRNNISKIEKEYNNARQNLSGGLTPLRPVYVVTEWLEPNPDKVAVLLQSDAASEDTKIEFTEKWQDKTRWRRLPINGRKKDVLNTLGDPLDIETSSNGEQIMHYGNIREYGIVVLKMRGNDTLRVNYWKEPLGPEFTKSKADTVFGRR